jgi:hypothetical protein
MSRKSKILLTDIYNSEKANDDKYQEMHDIAMTEYKIYIFGLFSFWLTMIILFVGLFIAPVKMCLILAVLEIIFMLYKRASFNSFLDLYIELMPEDMVL